MSNNIWKYGTLIAFQLPKHLVCLLEMCIKIVLAQHILKPYHCWLQYSCFICILNVVTSFVTIIYNWG